MGLVVGTGGGRSKLIDVRQIGLFFLPWTVTPLGVTNRHFCRGTERGLLVPCQVCAVDSTKPPSVREPGVESF